jgi:hypothetical protein
MIHILTAIRTKLNSSDLSNDVSGRIYLDEYGDDLPVNFPYVVFKIISGVPECQFIENFEDVIIQFDLFSASKGSTEITTMFNHLKSLFDDVQLSLTGATMLIMERTNLVTFIDEISTPEGTATVKHWAVEYRVLTQEG